MQMIEVATLKSHPRNREFFDDIVGDKWEDFKKSIIRRGVVEGVVATQDLVIVSGHQRVRACKELGILEVPCRITHYKDFDDNTGTPKEDMILEDLICTNIMQRGVGNVNAQKMCKCIMELERIYGIKKGGNGRNQYSNSEIISEKQKTQTDLANSIGLDERQIRNYKELNNLIPELQSLIESGSMKATVGYKIWAKMPQEEQEKFFNEIGRDKIKTLTQKATEEYIIKNSELERRLKQEQSKPPKVEVKNIDNTDYHKIDELQDKIKKYDSDKKLLERELYIYKKDSEEYTQFKKEIETLTKTKEDLGRQIDAIKETTRLVSDIDNLLKTKLAPIKYSKSIIDVKNETIVMENLNNILKMVQDWCFDMKNIMPIENNFVEGMVIE